MTARALAVMLFRHKRKMAAVIGAALLCGGVWHAINPPLFRAQASVLIEGRRGEATPAVVALLRSAEVDQKVAERYGHALFPKTPPRGWQDAFGHALAIHVSPSGLIDISLQGSDREAVTTALGALIAGAQAQNTEIFGGKADPNRRGLEAQAGAAYDKLAAFRRATGVFDLDKERGALLARRSSLEAESTAAEAGAASLTDKLALLRRQMAETPATIQINSESERSHVVEEARSKLFQVQTKEQELLGKYLPSSPLVQAVREEKNQIEKLIQHYDTPQEDRVESGTNPIHQALQQELLQSETQLAEATAKSKTLTRQITEIDRRLDRFAANEKDLALLKQTVADADAKLAASRAPNRDAPIEGIAVVSPPHAGIQPTGFGAGGVFALSLVSGVAAALVVAAAAQKWSTRFATPADVESGLGLPVLTSIPREG